MAGLLNKDRDFWAFLESVDFISLTETWVEEKDWLTLKNKLSTDFVWDNVPAYREHKKGRAKSGFLIGIRKDWYNKECVVLEKVNDCVILTKVRDGNEWLNILSVYNSGDLRGVIRYLQDWDFLEEGSLVIGGDFNIRTGDLGKFLVSDEDEGGVGRNSKDKKVNNEGRDLINLIEEKGWVLLNGLEVSDACGEYTYVGARGNSVIDYVIVNDRYWNNVNSFRIERRVDSDHAPLRLQVTSGVVRKKTHQEEARYKDIYEWQSRDVSAYRKELKTALEGVEMTDRVELDWQLLKRVVKAAVQKKTIRIRRWKLGQRKWHDRQCARKKRAAKRAFQDWSNGLKEKSIYINKRKEWRQLCHEKQKNARREEEAELRSLKNETDVWKFINGSRRKGTSVDNDISLDEWKEHFRKLLDGTTARKCGVGRDNDKEAMNGERDQLTYQEFIMAVKRMKKKKAAGLDGIPNEAWIHLDERARDVMFGVIDGIWNGEDVPDDWKMASIVPLYKKGDRNMAGNYRGISLLPSAYKIYAEILRGRLEAEVNEKKVLPEGQAGFRKERSTMDNVFILNHIVQMEKSRKEKVYALFVDLKAAFDTVNREKLWKIMEKFGISQHIIEKIKGIYRETK